MGPHIDPDDVDPHLRVLAEFLNTRKRALDSLTPRLTPQEAVNTVVWAEVRQLVLAGWLSISPEAIRDLDTPEANQGVARAALLHAHGFHLLPGERRHALFLFKSSGLIRDHMVTESLIHVFQLKNPTV
jgi:hypothetical protein